MLDRKIKDKDARVELLEDKIKNEKMFQLTMGIVAIINLIAIGVGMITFGSMADSSFQMILQKYPRLLFVSGLGIILTIFMLLFSYVAVMGSQNTLQYYHTLIYLKEHEKKK